MNETAMYFIKFLRDIVLITIAVVGIWWVASPSAEAHGGGLDSTGGHRHTKTNTYHCHQCKSYPSVKRTQTNMVDAGGYSNAAQPKHPVTPYRAKFFTCEKDVEELKQERNQLLVEIHQRDRDIRQMAIELAKLRGQVYGNK